MEPPDDRAGELWAQAERLDKQIAAEETQLAKLVTGCAGSCRDALRHALDGKAATLEFAATALAVLQENGPLLDAFSALATRRSELDAQQRLSGECLSALRLLDEVRKRLLMLNQTRAAAPATGQYLDVLALVAETAALVRDAAVPLPAALVRSVDGQLAGHYVAVRRLLGEHVARCISVDAALGAATLKSGLSATLPLWRILQAAFHQPDWAREIVEPLTAALQRQLVVPALATGRTLRIGALVHDEASGVASLSLSLAPADNVTSVLEHQLDTLGAYWEAWERVILAGAGLEDATVVGRAVRQLFGAVDVWHMDAAQEELVGRGIAAAVPATPKELGVAVERACEALRPWAERWIPRGAISEARAAQLTAAAQNLPARFAELVAQKVLDRARRCCAAHLPLFSTVNAEMHAEYGREHTHEPPDEPCASVTLAKGLGLGPGAIPAPDPDARRLVPTFARVPRISATADALWRSVILEEIVVPWRLQGAPQPGGVGALVAQIIALYLAMVPPSRARVAAQLFAAGEPLPILPLSPAIERPAASNTGLENTPPVSAVGDLGLLGKLVRKAATAAVGSPVRPGPTRPSDTDRTLSQLDAALRADAERRYHADYLLLLQNDAYWLADRLAALQSELLAACLSDEGSFGAELLLWEAIFRLRGRGLNLATALASRWGEL